MANKLTTIIDFETQVAKSKLSDFKTAIGNADGASDKLKAGFGVAKDSIIANAGALSLGAGAALVGFGIKAVGAFEDTATAAIHLSDTIGINREDASRWIAIADDYGISADTLQGSLGKVSKTLDDTKWAEFGVATRDAGGEVRPVNDILLDTFDKLSAMTNAGDQAREGAKLFGKGYAAIAPLIGHTRDEYVKMLGSVEKGQVITDGEAKSSEAMRLAQDHLHDALQEVTLALGGLIAQGAPLITTLANIVEGAIEAKTRLEDVTGGDNSLLGGTDDSVGVFGKIAGAAADLRDRFKEVIKYGPFSTTEQQKQQDWAEHIDKLVVPSIDDLDRAHKDLAKGGMSDVEYQEKQNEIASANYAAQVDKTNREVDSDIQAMENKWDELHGKISQEKALINYRQDVEATKQAMLDAGTAATEHGVGSPEHVAAIENARLKQLDLESETADLAQKYSDMPAEKVTDLIAQIDSGSIDALPIEIQNAIDAKKYRIDAHLDNIIVDGETHAAGTAAGGIHVGGGLSGARAAGGPVSAGAAYKVGERGPETFVPNTNGTIVPDGGGDTYNTYHINGANMTPDELVRALKVYERRNGPGWRS